jgi:hypothetical protein
MPCTSALMLLLGNFSAGLLDIAVVRLLLCYCKGSEYLFDV